MPQDDNTTQWVIAAEFHVWADTYEQARRKLQHGLDAIVFDSEMEEARDATG